MTKKFSSFKGHQLITESWRTFVDGSETSAQGSEMELEEGLFSQSMAVQGEIDKHVLNLFRVLEALRPVDRKEIIDPIINELQAIANEDSAPQIDDDPDSEMELEEAATDYHKFIDQGYSQATAQAMASGSPEKKAQYDKLRDQGYSDSEARRFVYGRSYSAMGQR